jgi:hypothetical protein
MGSSVTDPLAAPLSRFIVPFVLLAALLGAAPATAGLSLSPKHYTGQTRLGVATSSRSAEGSCSTASGLLADLVLRCGDSNGHARGRYMFTLPNKAGSVTWQVNFVGSRRGASVSTKRISDTQFRVSVTQDGAGRADIESVTIEYYVCG